ncbi:hypothetical protein DNP62_24875 [Salmonella enterica subsp. enterica serovar Panama]|nr:hypothetical protein DNP62_24875 [Salmonella enterica subsp. enterica serovar Panama]
MGSCAAPSAKGDDKFITTDYLQQCRWPGRQGTGPRQRGPIPATTRHQGPKDGAGARQRCRAFCCARAAAMSDAKIRTHRYGHCCK